MEIKRVKAADVFEDEMNPRQDFGDLKALAESFSANGGQPYTPPIIVKDGQNYRIADGARRFRAMTKVLGVEEFDAMVCEDFDEADTILAMLATDDKKALTDEEKSRGVQRALFLGVEVSKVEKASKRANLGKAKRAMERVGDAAPTMSIERLIAIEENAGDQEAAAKLAKCSEDDWRRVLREIETKRKADAKAAAFAAVFERLGVDLVEERYLPSGCRHVYISAPTAEEFEAKAVGENIEFAVMKYAGLSYMAYDFYTRAEEAEDEEERTEAQRRCEELRSAFMATADQTLDDRGRWYFGGINDASHAKATKRFLTCKTFNLDGEDPRNQYSGPVMERILEDRPDVAPDYCDVSGWLAAYLWRCVDDLDAMGFRNARMFDYSAIGSFMQDGHVFRLWLLLDLYEAMQADGYEMTEADEKLAETFGEMLALYGYKWDDRNETKKEWF